MLYCARLESVKNAQEAGLEFEPGKAGVEAAKLKELGDADGSQIQRQPDAGRFTLPKWAQYILPREKREDENVDTNSSRIKNLR